MPRKSQNGYWIVDGETGERIELHRTRQAVLDTWRLRFTGRPIKIVRHYSSGETLIVEGTWHQAKVTTRT